MSFNETIHGRNHKVLFGSYKCLLFCTQKTKTIISTAHIIFLNSNPHTYNKIQPPNKRDNMICMFPEM